MKRFKYLLLWPLSNIRQNRWISAASAVGVAFAVFLVVTLLGFVGGYERAVGRDVDRMGFDMLVTARGCPYEAATLMLKGGVGLRYMPEGVVEQLSSEPEVTALFPTLIHPVRDVSREAGMALLKGVEADFFEAQGLEMREGSWLGEPGGVVLGFEAAEFDARHPGDIYLLPASGEREEVELKVVGVLERTGTQVDGTALLLLDELQERFGLAGKLTGVGVRVAPEHRPNLEELRERYDNMAELQVIRLSTVVEALRVAMVKMRGVVNLLAGVLAIMAGGVLLNTTMLRTLSEHRRFFLLHAIGFSGRFLVASAMIESLLVVFIGAVAGLAAATFLGGWTTELLTQYLPYKPEGNLVEIGPSLAALALIGSLALGALATVPALVRLRFFSGLTALRGE